MGAILGWASAIYADVATVEALGNARLVLEDETTTLSLFNVGNPAASVFLPAQDRLDLLAVYRQQNRATAFVTGNSYTASGNTSTASGVHDPFGNTLSPNTRYAFHSVRTVASLFDPSSLGVTSYYQGVLTRITPEIALQFIPLGTIDLSRVQQNDASRQDLDTQVGARVRGSILVQENASVGFGGLFSSGHRTNAGPAWPADALGATLPALEERVDERSKQSALEVGGMWRQAAVFSGDDYLDLGLWGNAGRTWTTGDHALGPYWTSEFTPLLTASSSEIATAMALNLAGVYKYKTIMDIGLLLGLVNEDKSLGWDSETLGHQEQALTYRLDNLRYQLSFRVRLPMVREDDLRFGILFTNDGLEGIFPTGRLLLTDANYQALPVITTASSGIGIGAAFVPEEGSIIALEYRQGSSKSRQDTLIVSDTGVGRFALGAQYRVWEGWFARLGYTFERRANQVHGLDSTGKDTVTVSQATDDSSLRLGVGWQTGAWTFNLTGIGSRIFHNPEGWAITGKPAGAETESETEQTYSALLGLTWMF